MSLDKKDVFLEIKNLLKEIVKEIKVEILIEADLKNYEIIDFIESIGSTKIGVLYDTGNATKNNFMQTPFYDEPRAFLISDAAKMLIKAHQELNNYGYGIVIYDAYRPWFVTKMFWDATPDSLKNFVASHGAPNIK